MPCHVPEVLVDTVVPTTLNPPPVLVAALQSLLGVEASVHFAVSEPSATVKPISVLVSPVNACSAAATAQPFTVTVT